MSFLLLVQEATTVDRPSTADPLALNVALAPADGVVNRNSVATPLSASITLATVESAASRASTAEPLQINVAFTDATDVVTVNSSADAFAVSVTLAPVSAAAGIAPVISSADEFGVVLTALPVEGVIVRKAVGSGLKLFIGRLFSPRLFIGRMFRGGAAVSPPELDTPKGGGAPAYYVFDGEQEAKDKQAKQYPKQKQKANKSAQQEIELQPVASYLPRPTAKTVAAPVVDKALQAFLAQQEQLAAQAIADALEEEEIGMLLMMI